MTSPLLHESRITVSLRNIAATSLLSAFPASLMAVMEVLREDEKLQCTLRHDLQDNARPELDICILPAPSTTTARMREFGAMLQQLARHHFPGIVARSNELQPEDATLPHATELRPVRLLDWTRQPLGPRGLEGGKPAAATAGPVNVRALELDISAKQPAHLLLALQGLGRLPGRVAIRFIFSPCQLQANEILSLQQWLEEHETMALPSASDQQLAEEVRTMLKNGRGYRLQCVVASDEPVSGVVLDHLCQALYGCLHDSSGETQVPTWSREIMFLRGLIPVSAAIGIWGEHAQRPLPPGRDDIIMGTDRDGNPHHLSLRDRKRHTYLIGITGTGKSTLMLNMALQDMEAGRSVILFDPHGDLWEQMRRVVPAARREDVQLCHLADPRWAFTINVLSGVHGNSWQDASMVANTIHDLFKRIVYKDVPEAFGPLFDALFRNALMLLVLADHPQLTLADLERVFLDKRFRRWLLQRVDDTHQEDFWNKIFPGLSGDWNRNNLTFHVTSKLAQIVQNPLLKPVLTSPHGSLSFMEVLREQRICLINFAKGEVGARDASFVAGLLSLRLGMAAMAQAQLPPEERKSACVYMDEFQNYASFALGDMLAETRKYGLHITLAHQTLGQIERGRAVDDLRHDVLANTANKLIFRVGRTDAEALEHFVAPYFDARDLSAIDDHQMVALLLEKGQTRRPLLLHAPKPPRLYEVNDPPRPEPPQLPRKPAAEDDAPPPRQDDSHSDGETSLLDDLKLAEEELLAMFEDDDDDI